MAEIERRLVVVASSEGGSADLEFIAGPSGDLNIEDRIRQLQQHDADSFMENETSLRLLRAYASSVKAPAVPRHRHRHCDGSIRQGISRCEACLVRCGVSSSNMSQP